MSHKRILVAIDAVTACKELSIAQRAHAIALQTGAEMCSLKIEPNLAACGMGGAIASLTELESVIHSELGDIKSSTFERGDHIWLTDQLAEQVHADLVVTAEHTSESLLLNRDDDKALLRNAHQDMLFVKNGTQSYQQILCLVNIEHKNASILIKKAKQFADEVNAQLSLAYVIGAYPYAGLELLGQREVICEEEDYLQTCADHLQRIAEPFDIPTQRQHIRVGKLVPIIKQQINALQADLLIMANQHQLGLRKLGRSLPAKMIHQVECDLLAIYCDDRVDEKLKRFYYH